MAKQVLPVYNICNLATTTTLKSELIIDRFEHYLSEHTDLHFPHKHSFYHLVYFTKGGGNHSIDFLQFPVKAGQIYFMTPGQVHGWDFKGAVDGYIINFSAAYLDTFVAHSRYLESFDFFSGTAEDQVIQVPAESRQQVTILFERMLRENQSAEEFKNDMIRTAMIQLFIVVNRLIKKDRPATINKYNAVLLHNFKKLIDTHYKEKKLTSEYAALLFITPNHLNALCKNTTSRSAGELIRDRVLLEAKRLLVNAEMNVAEIAAALNFADNSYFTKFFKKYTGVTPEIFRKQFDSKK